MYQHSFMTIVSILILQIKHDLVYHFAKTKTPSIKLIY